MTSFAPSLRFVVGCYLLGSLLASEGALAKIPCETDADCPWKSTCIVGAAGSACSGIGALQPGESCTWDRQCEPGLRCYQAFGICGPAAACAKGSTLTLPGNHTCGSSSVGLVVAICARGSHIGGPCLVNTNCAAGLYCSKHSSLWELDPNMFAGSECLVEIQPPFQPAGADWSVWINYWGHGQCAKAGGANVACVSDKNCGAGLVCNGAVGEGGSAWVDQFTGDSIPGAMCTAWDWDLTYGSFCSSYSVDLGRCSPPGKVGAPCVEKPDCVAGLYCGLGACRRGTIGDPCATSGDCGPDLECNVLTASCGLPDEEGTPCPCASPLVCKDTTWNKYCVAPECTTDGDCLLGKYCVAGLCKALPGAGSNCQIWELCKPNCNSALLQCAPGLACSPFTHHCEAPVGPGGTCGSFEYLEPPYDPKFYPTTEYYWYDNCAEGLVCAAEAFVPGICAAPPP